METMTSDDVQLDTVLPALKSCPLFQALKDDHFSQILKISDVVRFAGEEVMVSEGTDADAFYVIIEGDAVIRLSSPAGEDVDVGKIPTGASFGEVGLLLGQKRTASVVALNNLTALKFSQKAFDTMFQKIPRFGVGLSRGLAHRLDEISGQIPLPKYDTRKGAPGTDVLNLIPKEFCQRHRVMPLEVDGNVLTVGVVDDPTTAIVTALRQHVPGMELHTVRAELPYFNEVMQTHSGIPTITQDADSAESESRPEGSPELNALLKAMVAEGASDLHLSAGHKPRWRINGDMHEVADGPVVGKNQAYELLKPVLTDRHREQYEEGNDADFAYTASGLARFRVNVFKDHRGAGAVFRQIPSQILSLEQLGFPPVIQELCNTPKGLVLVTGPTGCGKSTTLAAMIGYINNNRKDHIVTIEDPIEFVHPSASCLVNQREIGSHVSGYARGLKSALREDPDVVMIGEMRDLETIALALETANTGHLVFATVHTNSAVSTVDRIVDAFPAEEQSQIRNVLSDVLRGVITQTLVKKKEGGRTGGARDSRGQPRRREPHSRRQVRSNPERHADQPRYRYTALERRARRDGRSAQDRPGGCAISLGRQERSRTALPHGHDHQFRALRRALPCDGRKTELTRSIRGPTARAHDRRDRRQAREPILARRSPTCAPYGWDARAHPH